MVGQKVKYQSLDHREWELEEFTVIDEQGCGHFLAGSTTALREAVNDLKTRPAALKLIHFHEQQVNRFDEHHGISDSTVAGTASLNLQSEMGIAVNGRVAEHTRAQVADTDGRH
jgi:hypothetical protein